MFFPGSLRRCIGVLPWRDSASYVTVMLPVKRAEMWSTLAAADLSVSSGSAFTPIEMPVNECNPERVCFVVCVRAVCRPLPLCTPPCATESPNNVTLCRLEFRLALSSLPGWQAGVPLKPCNGQVTGVYSTSKVLHYPPVTMATFNSIAVKAMACTAEFVLVMNLGGKTQV